MDMVNKIFAARLNIKDYILANIFVFIPLTGTFLEIQGKSPEEITWLEVIIMWGCILALVLIIASRLRDIKISGKWSIFALIPFLNALLWLILFFIPSRYRDWDAPKPRKKEKPEEFTPWT
jgi:uncharacterized membrane protein YhaH (DUF805 family)